MTDKHTPGPWVAGKQHRRSSVYAQNIEVGFAREDYARDGIDGTTAEANARLIAAAPELLDQLRFAVKLLRPFGNSAQVQAMEAAIAKATA